MNRIRIIDHHLVQVGKSVELQPHIFDGAVQASHDKLYVAGHAVAREGDRVVNTRPHIPSGGSFIRSPTDDGRITRAGQDVLYIGSRPVAVKSGLWERCDDVNPRATLGVATSPAGMTKLFVCGVPVILSR